jgi:hypothetical protein
MRTRFRVAGVALIVALLATGLWLALRDAREPRYQGKTAKQWFEQCAQSVETYGGGVVHDTAAMSAVLHFGEQAAPCLADGMRQRKKPKAEQFNNLRRRLPEGLKKLVPARMDTGDAWRRSWAAHEIVKVAPLEVKRAVTRLVLPDLVAEVSNPKTPDRGYRLAYMRVLQPEPDLILPDLNRLLVDADPLIRQNACAFLPASVPKQPDSNVLRGL